jgi:F0F1-type ATP synthase assembly protein I
MQKLLNKIGYFPTLILEMIRKLSFISLVLALLVSAIFGLHAGISVFCGASSVIIGLLISTPIANKARETEKASIILVNALKAEGIKIIVIFFLLWLAFSFYENIVPIAIVFGLSIAAIYSGIGVTKIES